MVQGWVADDPTDRDARCEAVACLICAQIYLVNPKTASVWREGDDENRIGAS
jgi:hypothetical protein